MTARGHLAQYRALPNSLVIHLADGHHKDPAVIRSYPAFALLGMHEDTHAEEEASREQPLQASAG